jgi:hypothetical protein
MRVVRQKSQKRSGAARPEPIERFAIVDAADSQHTEKLDTPQRSIPVFV